MYNNSVYDFFQSSQTNYGFRLSTSVCNLYHNLAYNCNRNFEQSSGTTTATNNVSFGSDDDFVGTFATLTYSAMDGADAGTGNINGITWADVFDDHTNGYFRFKSTDTDLIGAGTDDPGGSGYGDPGIAQDSRSSTWNIGTDENTTPAAGVSILRRMAM